MDIIYSRRKIRFKKLNQKQKLKLLILALVFIIWIGILIYIKAAYPIFLASCRSNANSIATNLVTNEVKEVMKKYDYEDLVEINKDQEGNITLIKAKGTKITQIVQEITQNIQSKIDYSDTTDVYINLGKITGITILKYIGPTFKIEMERAGRIKTNVYSEFDGESINQSVHRIMMDIECKISILTPFESVEEPVSTTIMLAESVVVGQIPETYDYYDIEEDKVLDAQ